MRLHFLVEGLSDKAFLQGWLRRFIPGHTYRIYPHEGKGRLPDNLDRRPSGKGNLLLDQLPAKLRAFGRSLDSAEDRVVVFLDLDNQDCQALKRRLERAVDICRPAPMVLIRFAIEELEAFYLGDIRAVQHEFGSIRRSKYREYQQDSICGTWEIFKEVIGAELEDKVGWANRMGRVLGLAWQGAKANRSPSFRGFCQGILKLTGESPEHR